MVASLPKGLPKTELHLEFRSDYLSNPILIGMGLSVDGKCLIARFGRHSAYYLWPVDAVVRPTRRRHFCCGLISFEAARRNLSQ